MNPLIQLLLVALVAFGVIFFIALLSSVLFLAAGSQISRKQFDSLKAELASLLDGDADLAEKLLDGEAEPEDCPEKNREAVTTIVESYRQEQQRIREASERQQKSRPTKGRIRKFLGEKKEKGEWQ